MLVLKYLVMIAGAGLFGSAAALVGYDIFLSTQLRRGGTPRLMRPLQSWFCAACYDGHRCRAYPQPLFLTATDD
jgi:hypothetical protein